MKFVSNALHEFSWTWACFQKPCMKLHISPDEIGPRLLSGRDSPGHVKLRTWWQDRVLLILILSRLSVFYLSCYSVQYVKFGYTLCFKKSHPSVIDVSRKWTDCYNFSYAEYRTHLTLVLIHLSITPEKCRCTVLQRRRTFSQGRIKTQLGLMLRQWRRVD